MVYLLTILSALSAIIGNFTAKYWADDKGWVWMFWTIVVYVFGTITYLWTLRIGGKFTVVNTLFYAIVPVATIVGGWFLFRERLTNLQIVAMILGLISIILFTLEHEAVVR